MSGQKARVRVRVVERKRREGGWRRGVLVGFESFGRIVAGFCSMGACWSLVWSWAWNSSLVLQMIRVEFGAWVARMCWMKA